MPQKIRLTMEHGCHAQQTLFTGSNNRLTVKRRSPALQGFDWRHPQRCPANPCSTAGFTFLAAKRTTRTVSIVFNQTSTQHQALRHAAGFALAIHRRHGWERLGPALTRATTSKMHTYQQRIPKDAALPFSHHLK